MVDVVIAEAVRSAVGRRRGSLAHVEAPDLLGDIYLGLIGRTGIDPAMVGQVVAGCVGQIGAQSGNVGRNAWLGAGLPVEVPATTVNVQCGSSQQAFNLAYNLIASGQEEVAIAAGVESMDQVPLGAAAVAEFGASRTARYEKYHEITSQFEGAERIAAKWGLSRDDLDAYGLRSQELAAAALAENRFASQIIPVEAHVVGADGSPAGTALFDRDEVPRSTSAEALAGLKPVLGDRPDGGFHTAGTSSAIADGASALLLTTAAKAEELALRPRARVVGQVLVGSDPVLMLTGPIPATRSLLDRTGLTIEDIDVFEINEAFAAVVLAWQRDTGAEPTKVNPNGGAIALGHPLGATGGILLTKALAELERTNARYGLVSMCCGGGIGTGTIIERLD